MSEYQRFISYMYEYRNGKKSTNCGYARVENRNRLCRLEIHMKTSPQTLEEPLRIYGCFHRDGRLFGILLGQHAPVLDMVNWRYQGDPDNLNASLVPLSQLEGLILSDGSQIAYCSMWNDTVIDPGQMTLYAREEPASVEKASSEPQKEVSPEAAALSDNIPKEHEKAPDLIQANTTGIPPAEDKTAVLSSQTDDKRAVLSPQADAADAMDLAADSVDIASGSMDLATDSANISSGSMDLAADSADFSSGSMDISMDSPNISSDSMDIAADSADFSSDSIAIPPEDDGNPQVPPTSAQGDENDMGDRISPSATPADTAPVDAIVSAAASLSPGNGAPDETATDGMSDGEPPETAPCDAVSAADAKPDAQMARARMPESSPADFALEFQKKQVGQNPVETADSLSRSSSPWEQVQAAYPQINPFTDDEIGDCVRIELTDLPTLRQNGWRIAGNRFILHSFQKNRHLVLGRLKNNGRYIFAVPGYYDNQERFMANMFGFPYFKSSDGGPLRYGQKGYWYRLLY